MGIINTTTVVSIFTFIDIFTDLDKRHGPDFKILKKRMCNMDDKKLRTDETSNLF